MHTDRNRCRSVELEQHVTARPARVLVAPDSFKGTFSALDAGAAIAEGLVDARLEVVVCPVADGGEGTLAVVAGALHGELRAAACRDALARPIVAEFVLLDRGRTALVEAAAAIGLPMIADTERDAEASTSAGVGDLIVAALAHDVEHLIVSVGGVASTDGGRGAIDIVTGCSAGVAMTVLCDVDTVFEDAAVVFGPQKGADQQAVVRLTEGLNRYAETLPRDPRGIPRTGAAGGLSGGLWAAFGADLVSGAEYVLDLLDFDSLVAGVDVVVTGEGAFDGQSLRGKVVGEVIRRAAAASVPCFVVAGRTDFEELPAGVRSVVIASTREELVAAGREIAAITTATTR